MPKTKTLSVPQETNPIEQKLDLVLQALKDLKDVFTKPAPPEPSRTLPTNEQGKAPETTSTIQIPAEYRQLVDSVLNSQFGIELESAGDPLSIVCTIIVPDKYSPMTESQREVMKRDIRPKVLDRSLGVNGLREWCDVVYRNFSPEMQALIVADRNK